MNRLLTGALVALFSFGWAMAAAPRFEAGPDPLPGVGTVACVALGNFEVGVAQAGGEVLGVRPAPFSHALLLYWRQGNNAAAAPVFPAIDGSGPCVAYRMIMLLGAYSAEVAS